jgi:hypothetical protein
MNTTSIDPKKQKDHYVARSIAALAVLGVIALGVAAHPNGHTSAPEMSRAEADQLVAQIHPIDPPRTIPTLDVWTEDQCTDLARERD